jgi:Ala-tRNA(Pro) deacylase
MTLAVTLQRYLTDQKIEYDVVTHRATASSSQTAQASHVPGDFLAKAVVVKDEDHFMVAVLPASHHIQLRELSRLLDRPLGLATEEEASDLFAGCEPGAFPAIGSAYGLEVIVEDSLAEQADVYVEGGDHTSLVHLKAAQFRSLMAPARYGKFGLHD